MSIFCDGTVNKAVHKLKIGCIAEERKGGILAKFSKYKNGDSILMAEVLEVKVALELELECGW